MKKLLLGTTALATAFALSMSDAHAQLELTIGGTVDFQAGYADQDLDAGTRDYLFQVEETELKISGDFVADNGLSYGVVVELLGDVSDSNDNKGVNADETYLYLGGSFGRFEMGSTNGAAQNLTVSTANFARATGGVSGDWYQYVSGRGVGFIVQPEIFSAGLTTTSGDNTAEDANKISYYTPRFSGFQLGASFTPDLGDVGTAAAFSGDSNVGQAETVWDAGLNYTGEFSGVGLAAAATGQFGEGEATSDDLRAYNFGLNLSYQGFTVGGSYGIWDETPITSDDSDYWDVGAAFETGPFGFSVTYLDSTLNDSNDLQNISLGADYQLAPGLVPYVEVNFFELDPAGTASDNDGTVVLVGTQLNL